MKPIWFLGDSHKALKEFPKQARQKAGHQLVLVQRGLKATDSKPMTSIGRGVEEIRVWEKSGTYRIVYIARFVGAVYVLHAFQKKTRATSQADIDLVRERFQQLMRGRR